MASSTFNAVKDYLYPPVKDPYMGFTLQQIVILSQINKNFRTKKLIIKWIKEYCENKKIPLLLPIQAHKTIQAVALGIAIIEDKNTKEHTPDEDQIECSKVYLAEVLDGIYNLMLALDIKQEIKRIQYYGVYTEADKESLESRWDLYFTHLNVAAGKENFYAMYLLLFEALSSDLKNKTLHETMQVLKEVEQTKFVWMSKFYGVAVQIYIAELYYSFALTLFDKVLTEKKKNLEFTIFLNKINNAREYQSLINECHMVIVECIFNARAALNLFEQEGQLLDLYTKNNMIYFRENITGFNPKDTVLKLRLGLAELDSKNNTHIRPPNTPSFMLNSNIVVNVNPADLPWQDRLLILKTPVVESEYEQKAFASEVESSMKENISLTPPQPTITNALTENEENIEMKDTKKSQAKNKSQVHVVDKDHISETNPKSIMIQAANSDIMQQVKMKANAMEKRRNAIRPS